MVWRSSSRSPPLRPTRSAPAVGSPEGDPVLPTIGRLPQVGLHSGGPLVSAETGQHPPDRRLLRKELDRRGPETDGPLRIGGPNPKDLLGPRVGGSRCAPRRRYASNRSPSAAGRARAGHVRDLDGQSRPACVGSAHPGHNPGWPGRLLRRQEPTRRPSQLRSASTVDTTDRHGSPPEYPDEPPVHRTGRAGRNDRAHRSGELGQHP